MSAAWSILIIVIGGAASIGLYVALSNPSTGPEMIRGARGLVDDMRRERDR